MKDDFNRYIWMNSAVILGALAIAVVAFYLLAGDITARSNAIAVARTQIAGQNNSLAAVAEIKQDSAEAAQYKTAMDELLPVQNDLINFPQWLESVAATYNVTAGDFFYRRYGVGHAHAGRHDRFPLTTEGGSDGVVPFLEDL